MNPKTFLAFALGCFVAGGAAYYLGKAPATVKPEAPAVAQTAATGSEREQSKPAQDDATPPVRVISPAGPEDAAPPAAPAKRTSVEVAGVAKPSPSKVPVAATGKAPAVAVSASPSSAQVAQPIPAVDSPRGNETPPAPVQSAGASASTPPPPVPKFEALPPPAPEHPAPAPKVVAPPKANSVTIVAGTPINIRLQEALSSERNRAGDAFQATLDQAIIVDGFVIAERGSRVEGRIVELDRAGKVKGVARLVLELSKLNTSDGQRVQIQTSGYERKGEESRKSDAAKVGLGAAIGAAIGGIAGGGKGAAAGAGVGGAAGAGEVLLTRGKPAVLPVETRLTFRLQDPVTLTEKLN